MNPLKLAVLAFLALFESMRDELRERLSEPSFVKLRNAFEELQPLANAQDDFPGIQLSEPDPERMAAIAAQEAAMNKVMTNLPRIVDEFLESLEDQKQSRALHTQALQAIAALLPKPAPAPAADTTTTPV